MVHMDDLLALTVTKDATAAFVGLLRSMFKFEDPVEASYYKGCHNALNQGKNKNEVGSTALRSNEHVAIP